MTESESTAGPASAPGVLIIDGSVNSFALLSQLIKRRFPAASITFLEPKMNGFPAKDFAWGAYDVVLLDFELGLAEENGLDWLQRLSGWDAVPPVIMMTRTGDARTAARAMRLGAQSYFPKTSMGGGQLALALHDILDGAERHPSTPADPTVTLVTHAVTEPPASSPWDAPTVEGFDLIRRLAKGGMSSVYLAREHSGERNMVVLKVLFLREGEEDPVLLRRFMREHALLTRLDHPSVAGIYEHGFAEDFAYIAMEYFPGGMLRDRINGRGTMGEALGYVSSICAGLSAVHSLNIVHRDLKPTNILFRADGTLAIADFGISRDLTQASDLTASTGWLGTPPYMSPEQITSEALDTRSDLYSLGVMLFELLAGERPFRHRSLPGLLSAHLYDPVPQLPAASRVCQSLVERLLAKRPEDRVSTAREAQILIDELKEYVG